MKAAGAARRRFLLGTVAGSTGLVAAGRVAGLAAPRAVPAVRAAASPGLSAHAMRYYRTAAF